MPPLAGTCHTFADPPSFEPKAIDIPSGDQTGDLFWDLKNVICWGEPPSSGRTKILDVLPSFLENAIRDPSGEKLGSA